MKVCVWMDEDTPLGLGEMTRENVYMFDFNEELVMTLHDHPKIVMEDGEIYLGCEVWWIPL